MTSNSTIPSSMSTDSSEAVVLDGKATAKAVRADVAVGAAALSSQGRPPGLTVVLVGDDPASQVYVRSKDKAATECPLNAWRLAAALCPSLSSLHCILYSHVFMLFR